MLLIRQSVAREAGGYKLEAEGLSSETRSLETEFLFRNEESSLLGFIAVRFSCDGLINSIVLHPTLPSPSPPAPQPEATETVTVDGPAASRWAARPIRPLLPRIMITSSP